ncbi:hypothetical protein [Pseudomonas sp. UFMG81]|uniref:hypothetical protein n=1 Tax=Pseudomonas sp. UFMG81 TaxID=2745936 RepID=UPI001890B2DD|nr:hypothetical protein [Pseudomonas sp. UFMG81]
MAAPYISEKSFIARLAIGNTKYPGPVGRWEYRPGYNGTKRWQLGGWLTTSRQDREPQTLWFGAVKKGDGYAYEIRLWTGDRAHAMYNQRVDISTNDYLGLYELTSAVGPLWKLDYDSAAQARLTTLEGKAVGVRYDKAFWTSGLIGSYLQVGRAPAAEFDVEIVQMGVDEPR